MSKSLSFLSALAILGLMACADPTGGGGGGGAGGSGGSGSSSDSRSNARAMAISNSGKIAVAQSYTSVSSGSLYNFSGQVQVSTDGGSTFTATSPTKYYSDVKMSADGTTIAAYSPMASGAYNPAAPASATSTPITVSTDGGTTWTEPTGLASAMYRGWSVSPDGSKIFLVGRTATPSTVYYVSNDNGATFSTWTPPTTSPVSGQTPTGYLVLNMTNDKVLVQENGGSFSGTFLVSWSDFVAGTNWASPLKDSASPPTTVFSAGSISADDQSVLLVTSANSAPAKLWFSSNGGSSFSELTSLEAGTANFADKYVLSSDGASIVHMSPGSTSSTNTVPPTFNGGGLEKASVSDIGWTALTSAGTHGWTALAIAPDGLHMVATDGSPTVYHSANGSTFASHGFNNFPGGTPQTPPVINGGGGGMGGGNYGTLTLTHGSNPASQQTITGVSFQAGFHIISIMTSTYQYALMIDSTTYDAMLTGSAVTIPADKINTVEIHSGQTFLATGHPTGALSITGTHTNGSGTASLSAFQTSTSLSFTSSTGGGASWSDAVTIAIHLTSTIPTTSWSSANGGGGGGSMPSFSGSLTMDGTSHSGSSLTMGLSYGSSSYVDMAGSPFRLMLDHLSAATVTALQGASTTLDLHIGSGQDIGSITWWDNQSALNNTYYTYFQDTVTAGVIHAVITQSGSSHSVVLSTTTPISITKQSDSSVHTLSLSGTITY